MTPYEILLMLDPELPEERQSEIVQRTRARGAQRRQRRRPRCLGSPQARLRDRPQDRRHYHLLTFTAETETLEEISRILKITDGVMRHLAVRRSERRPGETVAASAPARQDGAEAETVASEEE